MRLDSKKDVPEASLGSAPSQTHKDPRSEQVRPQTPVKAKTARGRPCLDALVMAARAAAATTLAGVPSTSGDLLPVDFFDVGPSSPTWGLPRPRTSEKKTKDNASSGGSATTAREDSIPLGAPPPSASAGRAGFDREAPRRPDAMASLAEVGAVLSAVPSRHREVRQGFGRLSSGMAGGPAFLSAIPEDLLVQVLSGSLASEPLACLAQASRKMKAIAKVVALQRLLEHVENEEAVTRMPSTPAPPVGPACPLHRLFLQERTEALLRPSMGVLWQPLVLASGRQRAEG
ncbi:unnamed protein product, partial [Durusdinium trenchii]